MTKNKRSLFVAMIASVVGLSGIFADGFEEYGPQPLRPPQQRAAKDSRKRPARPAKNPTAKKQPAPKKAPAPKAAEPPAPRVVIVEKPVRPSRLLCLSNFEKAPSFEVSLTAIETARSKMDFQKVSQKTLDRQRVTSKQNFQVTVTENRDGRTATNTVDVDAILSAILLRKNENYIETTAALTLILKPKSATMDGAQVTLGKTEQTLHAEFDIPHANDSTDFEVEPKNSCIKHIKVLCKRQLD